MESLGQMAAGVAHDLNNVLTVVQGYGELMIESKDLSPKHESMLHLIDEGPPAPQASPANFSPLAACKPCNAPT